LAVPIFAVAGFGMGLAYAQFALIVLRDVPRESQGEVTAGLTLSDSLGTVLGLTLGGAFVAAGIRGGTGLAPGLAAAIVVATVTAILGWLLAPRLQRIESARSGVAAEAGARLR
jgi:MFS family permease